MMRLADLFDSVPDESLEALQIHSLSCDSRKVEPGALFFAIPGVKNDGLAFALQAVEKGAVAVVSETTPPSALKSAVFIRCQNVRLALAQAAQRFFQRQPKTIVAVTGTSGKTSVAAFTRQLWQAEGFQAASIGTLGIVAPKGSQYGALTTPDPIQLHQWLAELAEQGVEHLAMEASSHGLDQYRLDGVLLQAAAFTNLSRDHLDYHPNVEHYLNAKMRLLTQLLPVGHSAVIDVDSLEGQKVAERCRLEGRKPFTIGKKGEDLHLLEAQPHADGSDVRLRYQGKEYHLRVPLIGAFQISNILVSIGLCLASGSSIDSLLAAVPKLRGAPGRLEKVGQIDGAAILVDYAHKPGALETILLAVRPFVSGRIVLVFGCGGDRDPGKRALMGEIAARLADVTIVTDDNPRSECPQAIRNAILETAKNALEVGDRRAAIAHGMSLLRSGDMLIIAGKGHEHGQIIGDKILPFSDHDVVKSLLQESES